MTNNRWLVGLVLTVTLFFASSLKADQGPEEGIPTGRFIAGGIVGTAVGLGIGHGIQKRYFPLGLVFSLGEAAGWIAFFADTTFTTGTDSAGFTTTKARHVGTVGVIGLVTLLGLHVWETVDVWITGNELHKKFQESHHRNTAFFVPVTFAQGEVAPGVSFGLHF